MDQGTFDQSISGNPGIPAEMAEHLRAMSPLMNEVERDQALQSVNSVASSAKENRDEAIQLSDEGLAAVKDANHVMRDETERTEHDDELQKAEQSLQIEQLPQDQ